MKPIQLFDHQILHACGVAAGLVTIACTAAAQPVAPSGAHHPPLRNPGKALEHTAGFTVSAPLEQVFPLLCPVREYDWLPNWQCEVLRSDSGYAEQECVFRTERADSGTMTWVVTAYEPPHRIEFTCFNTTTDHVMRLRIELSPTPGGGTRLAWRWRWIVTGPAGDGVVDNFVDANHAELVAGLESLMKYYLEHGTLPPPEPTSGG